MPSSDSMTSIFTSSGSERRECFRAFTTASLPLASTARTSPFTPFTSSRFPAASLPCQLKSWACILTAAATDSSAVIKELRINSSTWGHASTFGCRSGRTAARIGSVFLRVLRSVIRGVIQRIADRGRDGRAVEMEVEIEVGVVVIVIVVVAVLLGLPLILVVPGHLDLHFTGATQLDVAIERLHLEPCRRGAPANPECEAVLAGTHRVHREARVEIAVECRDRTGDARTRRNHHCHVPVMCRRPRR